LYAAAKPAKPSKVPKPEKVKSFKNMNKTELRKLYKTKMGAEPIKGDVGLSRFELIQSLEQSYNL
jgi:hypothetical protein